jgi:3-hydroxyacyl-CoA dehydrogenase/enoyl-CoA hydratase/3-hydroxybutyryl-CoA epimerase
MDENETIRWDRGDDDVVVLTLDAPGRSANTIDDAYVAAMGRAVDRLEAERDTIAGVVLTSAKQTFLAGADLDGLLATGREDIPRLAVHVREVKAQLRRIETLGRPVVAAINGAALGGGLELALAAHHRIVVDDPRAVVGFPEVQLGLLPGAGGVVRSVRMLGIAEALTKLLLEGKRLGPAQALELGVVGEVVPAVEDLLPAARRWIAANPDAVQPWDARGYRIPGGTPASPKLAAVLPSFPANLRKQLKGADYPAPRHIMAAAVEGTQVDFDGALEIEGRYFVDVATSQVAKNMIQAFFFDMRAVAGDRGGDPGRERATVRKVAVLGAGMMGAGIAYVCAKAGIEVVLQDVSAEAAQRGRAHSEALVAKGVERGRTTAAAGDELLARIVPTDDPAAAAGADLVVEAVFEDAEVKAAVLAEVERHVDGGALLASNTSTLPITQLAGSVSRPEEFIGLHFFSPVDRMPLLEIVKGERTSAATLLCALDLARQIGKTPIVVNDSRGFFTSRVIGARIDEALAMVEEGVPAASIEQASSQAGYPAPVLALADEVNLSLMRDIQAATRQALERDGGAPPVRPSERVVEQMLEADRPGKLGGAGFYEYDGGRRLGLWPEIAARFGGGAGREVPFDDLRERLLFAEALEAVGCVDEGVVETAADANIGSILGIGFPGWTGGVLQYVDGYAGGAAGFVARARELAARYGERFEPPDSLVAIAERGESCGDRLLPEAA